MNSTFSSLPLLKAAFKRHKPLVFESALLPVCRATVEFRIEQFDQEHIKRYHQLTGWNTSKTHSLHPCYLHMYGFKQHMQLMLRDEFPFALLGAVHLSNDITQVRPVCVTDSGVLSSKFGAFTRHNKGIVTKIISQYQVEEGIIWSSTSEFLMVDKSQKPSKRSARDLASEVNTDWQDTEQFACDISTIRQYARVSGDFNPIHLHNWSAKLFGFRSAIAHGMWSKARSLSILQEHCIKPFQCEVSFNRPLMLPAKVKLMTKITPTGQIEFQLTSENRQICHLNGQMGRT